MFFWIRGMYRILNQFRAVLAVAGAARPEAEWALGVAYSATGLVHPFIWLLMDWLQFILYL